MICMIWKQYQTRKEGAFIIELFLKKLKYKTEKKGNTWYIFQGSKIIDQDLKHNKVHG